MNRTTKMLQIKLSGRHPFFIFDFIYLFFYWGVGWGQPIVTLFTTSICCTDIFLICVCFIFILITLLCYLVFFLIGKLVYRSFFPVFQDNTPVYSQFSIGGSLWWGPVYSSLQFVSYCLWLLQFYWLLLYNYWWTTLYR